MCTVGERLYVIGGNHFRGTSDYDDVLSCEYYSPILDQWTPIAAMLRGQSDVGVAVFENKIYVVGGYSWNNRCMVPLVAERGLRIISFSSCRSHAQLLHSVWSPPGPGIEPVSPASVGGFSTTAA